MKYINMLRERGSIPLYGAEANALPIPASQQSMRESIRRERCVELNYEGIRYGDIRSWKIGEEILKIDF